MKIIICYNSNDTSNNIASATIDKFTKHPIENVIIDRINIDRINIIKYIKNKCENEMPILYIYNNRKNIDIINKLRKDLPEVIIELYDNKILYRPDRVPGNRLKTRVYLLADKILLDIEHDFKKLEVYQVNPHQKQITQTEKTAFDMLHPKGNSYYCYLTKEEAINSLKQHIEQEELYHKNIMNEIAAQLKKAKDNFSNLQQRNKEALENLYK